MFYVFFYKLLKNCLFFYQHSKPWQIRHCDLIKLWHLFSYSTTYSLFSKKAINLDVYKRQRYLRAYRYSLRSKYFRLIFVVRQTTQLQYKYLNTVGDPYLRLRFNIWSNVFLKCVMFSCFSISVLFPLWFPTYSYHHDQHV